MCVCVCTCPSERQLQCERLSQTSIARTCGRPPCVLPIQPTPPATTDCHQVINSAYNSFSSLTSWCQHAHVHAMSICLFTESSKLTREPVLFSHSNGLGQRGASVHKQRENFMYCVSATRRELVWPEWHSINNGFHQKTVAGDRVHHPPPRSKRSPPTVGRHIQL